MKQSAVVHARIEPRTKRRAEGVLKALGISPTQAIRLFYRQICLRGGVPFAVRVPNRLTKRTLARGRAGEGIRAFDSLDEMFESWEQ